MSPRTFSTRRDPFLRQCERTAGCGADDGAVPSDGQPPQSPVFKLYIRGLEHLHGISPENLSALETLLVRPFPIWKRMLDIVGTLAGIVVFSPLMIVIALLISLTSAGPVIFTQKRSGLGGKPFWVYKFRTMFQDAEARKAELLVLNERKGPAFKMKNDPRITAVGRLLRKTSLDELPQFFNVLKGDMSLVGPRPLPVDEMRASKSWHRCRLEVKPGITCLWQITSRDESCFDQWMRLDLEYIRNMSFSYDLKLLVMTIPAVLSRKGAY